jgi:heme/copper-type cytochrome/quinol oxidase subunit 1
MPPLPRRFFTTALVYLVLGALTGLHMSTALHFGAGRMHGYYVSAHTHVLLVGFLLMSVMGVALWKLPPAPERARPRRSWAGAAYWGLTLGTALRYLAEVWVGYQGFRSLHTAAVLGSTLQALAVLAFAREVWPRLRSTDRAAG